MHNLKNKIKRNIFNSKGFRTNRKIVVIESDDWGGIRTPNVEALTTLKTQGIKVEKCQYMINDSLETNEDLESLFSLLASRQKKPVITANFLTHNPCFEKIKESDFQSYYNEPVEDTLKKSTSRDRVFSLWNEGLSEGFFYPQLHGREHLNIDAWMADLRKGNIETRKAFDVGITGLSTVVLNYKRNSYQAAFGLTPEKANFDYSKILNDAQTHFHKMFNYNSESFIAPNYIWNKKIEFELNKIGIKYLQGSRVQKIPDYKKGEIQYKKRFLGDRNKFNQKYLVRNVAFEPFSKLDFDWVGSAMDEISNAFFWKKPAVICMHRANFIGSINPENRKRTHNLMETLLNRIEKKWPNVEYLRSTELGEII